MRGGPQPGFSTTIWKISSRICLQIRRPPPTRFRALHSIAQYRLNPARCQRNTVSGKTRKSVSFHRDQNRSATTQKSLSSGPSFGLGCLRFRPASCWRRAWFSSIRPRRLREVRTMLRTRAETGQTWQPSYSRWDSGLRSDVVELKGGRNCDEGQYLQRSVGEGASRYIYSHQMGGVSGVNQHWSQPPMISFKNGSDLQNSESSNAIHNRRLFCPGSCYPTALSFPGVMGRLLIRFPVAAKMALATDGATGGTPVSPNPPGGWSVTIM